MGTRSEHPDSVEDEAPVTPDAAGPTADDADLDAEASATVPADDANTEAPAETSEDDVDTEAPAETSEDDVDTEATGDASEAELDGERSVGEAEDGTPEPLPAATKKPRTHVRDLTRWHIPFHYLPAAIVIVAGIAMLSVGDTVGWFGGWLLAAALPIAIGGFLRSLWFAAIPMVVWGGWLVYASGADEDAALSNTPTLLGVCLGLIGVGATVVAQRAVFPATEPGAWEASVGRLVPPLDDGETSPLQEHTDEHTIELAVVEPIEASEAELEAAAVAAMNDATIAEVPLPTGDDADEADGAVAEFEAVDAEPAAGAGDDEGAREPEDEDEAADQPESELQVDEDVRPSGDDIGEAEPGDDTDADQLDDAPNEPGPASGVDDADAASRAEAEPEADDDTDRARDTATAAASNGAEPPVTEIPLEADPSTLDEGGHPTEFRAITEQDLAEAERAER